jgi:ATP-dependent Clp endopeptidase proteolytic subunit ClpP
MTKVISKADNSDYEEIWVTAFNEDAAQKFREKVIKRSEISARAPIVIYIDSYGGYVDSLAKMIETLDEIPNPIVTVCMGKAMSCGAILLSHGDIRYCGRHSRVMVHEVSAGAIGDVHDCHNDTKEGLRLNRYFLGLLAKNCGIKGGYDGLRRIIKERDGREIWLDAKSSLEFGLVDKIGLPKVNSITLFEVADVPAKKIELSGVKRATHKRAPRRASSKKK